MTDHHARSPVDSVEISIVCAVGRRFQSLEAVHREFGETISRTGRSVEFLYVIDGPRPRAEAILTGLSETRFPVRILRLARGFGESAALQYGFQKARGRFVLTMPSHFQVEPSATLDILDHLDRGCQVVTARREPRRDPLPNRLQARLFHWLVGAVARGPRFKDLTCGLRGLTTAAARRLDLYGDLHRFIPLLALRHGFDVVEIPVRQRREDQGLRVFRPGVYARRLLDILNVLILTRFTRKPLRFFGLIGMMVSLIGFGICAVLAAQRILVPIALADRPMLLLGLLMIVLGAQLASVGLLGEIIIFHSTRRALPEATLIELEPGAASGEADTE